VDAAAQVVLAVGLVLGGAATVSSDVAPWAVCSPVDEDALLNSDLILQSEEEVQPGRRYASQVLVQPSGCSYTAM